MCMFVCLSICGGGRQGPAAWCVRCSASFNMPINLPSPALQLSLQSRHQSASCLQGLLCPGTLQGDDLFPKSFRLGGLEFFGPLCACLNGNLSSKLATLIPRSSAGHGMMGLLRSSGFSRAPQRDPFLPVRAPHFSPLFSGASWPSLGTGPPPSFGSQGNFITPLFIAFAGNLG